MVAAVAVLAPFADAASIAPGSPPLGRTAAETGGLPVAPRQAERAVAALSDLLQAGPVAPEPTPGGFDLGAVDASLRKSPASWAPRRAGGPTALTRSVALVRVEYLPVLTAPLAAGRAPGLGDDYFLDRLRSFR